MPEALKPFSEEGRAHIVEVFSSLQGEGLRLGERQVFVRFGGCNLHCDYCDEPETIPVPSGAVWTRERLEAEAGRLAGEKPHKAVCWTGGEPLLHLKFLKAAMRWARGRGLENYLETNGALPEAFAEAAELCDVVDMDLKLPSAVGREQWSAHLRFLRVAPEKTFVKVVLTADSTESEWRQVIRLMQEAGPQISLVLQPATPVPDSRDVVAQSSRSEGSRGNGRRVETIPPERCLKFLRQAKSLLKDVRLIPQWHPAWGLP